MLSEYGCTNLARECLVLANMSDKAVTVKTAARGLRADTVPFVRHQLFKANRLISFTYALLAGLRFTC
jgi:hypothetical protein